MSKCQSNLRLLLTNLQSQPHFPRDSILNVLTTTSLNSKEFRSLYSELWGEYMGNAQNYRQITILLYLSLSKNIEEPIESGIQFIQGMILSRLVMLAFNDRGQFQVDHVLFYLQPTLELTVLKGLEHSKHKLLLGLLARVNSKEHKFNPIGFIVQMVIIRKIQKYLDQSSLCDFNHLLTEILQEKKLARFSQSESGLHFRHIAILRQEQDRQESYYLHFLNEKRLVKMKQPASRTPFWVQQAFNKVPRQLNLTDFSTKSVSKVFTLLSHVQVFASSPLIEQFDRYTRDEAFLTIFQQFLMGLNISSEPYQFHWEKIKRSLQNIYRALQSQEKCYTGTIVSEIVNAVELKEEHRKVRS